MEGILNKTDSKYLKSAIKLLRQGNTMLLSISKKTDLDVVSSVTAEVHDDVQSALEKLNTIRDFIVTDKYFQLSLDFNENV